MRYPPVFSPRTLGVFRLYFPTFFCLLIFTHLQSSHTHVYRDYKIGNLGNLGTYNSIT
uniref:Uncharacterized protein n=1 Tax=Siphoviridae sp. ctTic26 TaxID=2823583 RepID=A0A8S5LEG7_9CAUD|nr:MAG TPA: hypothetical protein [Siphoviridae sp. ctTic26]